MKETNESDLIERIKQDSPSLFEEVVLRYQDRIYNLCLYMLRHPEDARDAAQDSFVKAYRGLKDFAPRASLYTWLYRIAVNTCLDFKRKTLRRPLDVERSTEEVAAPGPSPERIYESKQAAEEVQLALERLPEKLRVAIVLREVEGLSYEEIVEVLGISTGTVKSRISRAREELRKLLIKTYGTK